MFSLFGIRLASRRVPLALSIARQPARQLLLSQIPTRFLWTSPKLLEPSTTTKTKRSANATTTDQSAKPKKSVKKRAVKKKPIKKPKVATKNKPKKKIEKKKTDVPRSITAPGHGPSLFTHWFQKYYNVNLPKPTTEELMKRTTEAAVEWKALSEEKKEALREEIKPLRQAALERRNQWFKDLKPGDLVAINKRRAAKGKARIRVKPDIKRPANSFVLYMLHYRETADVSGMNTVEIVKKAGENWKNMSDAQKEPWVTRYTRDRATYSAAKSLV